MTAIQLYIHISQTLFRNFRFTCMIAILTNKLELSLAHRCRLHGAIAPTAKKLWGRCPQVTHTGILLSFFETVKCTLKYEIIIMPVTKVAQISAQKCTKSVAASPGPAGGAYSAPPDLLAGQI